MQRTVTYRTRTYSLVFHLWAWALVSAYFNATYAGGKDIGNGGKGLVCINTDGTTTIRLLDYVKARDAQGLIPVPAEGADEFEKAKNLAARLHRFEPERAELYQKEIEDFKHNHRMLKNYQLFDIADSTEIGLPKGCSIQVMANQATPVYREDSRYRIDENLWNNLSMDDKAGLILHEVIYKEALELGQTTSDHTSYFNAYIASNFVSNDTYQEYIQILEVIKFPHRYHGQLLINIPSNAIHDDGINRYIDNGDFADGQRIVYFSPYWIYSSSPLLEGIGPDKDDRSVDFYPNGQIKMFTRNAGPGEIMLHWGYQTSSQGPLNVFVEDFCRYEIPRKVLLYASGVIQYLKVADDRGCVLVDRTRGRNNKTKRYSKNTWLQLDQDGAVIKNSFFLSKVLNEEDRLYFMKD